MSPAERSARIARIDRILRRAWIHQGPIGSALFRSLQGRDGLAHAACLTRWRRLLKARAAVVEEMMREQSRQHEIASAKAPQPVTRPAEVGALSGDQLDLFA